MDVRRRPYVGRATHEKRCWFNWIDGPNNECSFCKPRSSTTPKISNEFKYRNCLKDLNRINSIDIEFLSVELTRRQSVWLHNNVRMKHALNIDSFVGHELQICQLLNSNHLNQEHEDDELVASNFRHLKGNIFQAIFLKNSSLEFTFIGHSLSKTC